MIATIWRFRVAPELARDYAALDRDCDACTSGETWLGLHAVLE